MFFYLLQDTGGSYYTVPRKIGDGFSVSQIEGHLCSFKAELTIPDDRTKVVFLGTQAASFGPYGVVNKLGVFYRITEPAYECSGATLT